MGSKRRSVTLHYCRRTPEAHFLGMPAGIREQLGKLCRVACLTVLSDCASGAEVHMSQMRKDIFTDRWVIVADGDGRQTRDFHFKKFSRSTGSCVFCERNESATPGEVFATRRRDSAPNGPGWSVRVVPNSQPRLRIIVVATANDPTCLDPAILKRPGRFDRVVQFRNPMQIYAANTTSGLAPISMGSRLRSLSSRPKGCPSPNYGNPTSWGLSRRSRWAGGQCSGCD